MTITLQLAGGDPAQAAAPARDLLRRLGAGEPVEQVAEDDDAARRDLMTGVAIATLVLTVPGAIAATLDIHNRLKERRSLAAEVEALKTALAEAKSEARLTIDVDVTIDLGRTPTDAVVDRLLAERSRGR